MKPGLDKQTHALQPTRWERVFLETVLKFKWAHKINVKVRLEAKCTGMKHVLWLSGSHKPGMALAEDELELPIILSSSDGVTGLCCPYWGQNPGLCACELESSSLPTELHRQPRREECGVGYLFSSN